MSVSGYFCSSALDKEERTEREREREMMLRKSEEQLIVRCPRLPRLSRARTHACQRLERVREHVCVCVREKERERERARPNRARSHNMEATISK